MNATAGIVILVFVLTIFYASMGGNGGKPAPVVPKTPPAVSSTVDQASIPVADFVPELSQNLPQKIQGFILTFTKNKVSDWDANLMASSLAKYGQQYNVNPKLVTALIC
ncbi:MAG: hypothetical protein NT030_04620, partial [Candidatus Saganbacteria bacterium]|nr:hypothetical protein [Candidatus Saganbacteria bacterium]